MTDKKTRILILCTGNSCRSQMAEGWLKALGADQVQAFSAGTRPSGINPKAIQVMKEVGLDIRDHSSDDLRMYVDEDFDLVVTVCDHAKEACPVFPGAKDTLHLPFFDPYYAEGDEQKQLDVFRQVRDEIKTGMEKILNGLNVLKSK